MDSTAFTDRILGADPEILADPEVQKALNTLEQGVDVEAAHAITSTPADAFTKYGITLRKSGLQHKALMSRIMYSCPRVKVKGNEAFDIPAVTQSLFWLFTLAATHSEVYAAVGVLEREGLDAFITKVDEWFDAHQITGSALGEILPQMEAEMVLTNRLTMLGGETKPGISGPPPNV